MDESFQVQAGVDFTDTWHNVDKPVGTMMEAVVLVKRLAEANPHYRIRVLKTTKTVVLEL